MGTQEVKKMKGLYNIETKNAYDDAEERYFFNILFVFRRKLNQR